MNHGSQIRLHLYELPVKLSVAVDFEQAGQCGAPQARSYLNSLSEARTALLSCLKLTTAGNEPNLEDAASSYIGLLLGLVNSYVQAPGTPALDQDTGLSLHLHSTHDAACAHM